MEGCYVTHRKVDFLISKKKYKQNDSLDTDMSDETFETNGDLVRSLPILLEYLNIVESFDFLLIESHNSVFLILLVSACVLIDKKPCLEQTIYMKIYF